jgi:hypothetical protein
MTDHRPMSLIINAWSKEQAAEIAAENLADGAFTVTMLRCSPNDDTPRVYAAGVIRK